MGEKRFESTKDSRGEGHLLSLHLLSLPFFSSSRFSPAMPQAQTIPLQCIDSLAQAMILEREVTAQAVTLEKRS